MNIKNGIVMILSCMTIGLNSFGMSDSALSEFEAQVRREFAENRRLIKAVKIRQQKKSIIQMTFDRDIDRIQKGLVRGIDILRWVKEANDWVENNVRFRLTNANESDVAELMSRNAINRIDAWYYTVTGQFFAFSSRPDVEGMDQNAWDICYFVNWAFGR